MSEKKDILNKIIEDSSTHLSDKDIEDSILDPLMDEIDLIRDPSISSFVRSMLLKSDSFWDIPGSFSSVYHPPDEQNSLGNVLHTKRVTRIALIMCENYGFNNIEVDIVLAACILHDLTKGDMNDDGSISYDEFHPYTVDLFYNKVKRQDLLSSETQSSVMHVEEELAYKILRIIRCHHGANSIVPETVPITVEEMIVANANAVADRLHWVLDGDQISMDRWLL